MEAFTNVPRDFNKLCYLIQKRAAENTKRHTLRHRISANENLLTLVRAGCAMHQWVLYNRTVQRQIAGLTNRIQRDTKAMEKQRAKIKKQFQVIKALLKTMPDIKIGWDHSWGIRTIYQVTGKKEPGVSRFAVARLDTHSDEFMLRAINYISEYALLRKKR